MEQPITDYKVFLQHAREAVVDLVGLKERREQLNQEERQIEKTLDSEKKSVATLIQQMIKKRSEEITYSYDQELTKGQERLKKSRTKREKAKSKGMKERIQEETEELHRENKELRLQIKTLFKQNRIPAFCNTGWYYTIFYPRHIYEIFELILTLVTCFFIIPYGSYLLLPIQKPIYLVGIYLITILLFGGSYILVGNRTKIRNLKIIEQGRLIRDQIYSNNIKIKVIIRSIRKDRNDTIYNLQKYDDQIAQMEQELTEIGIRKREAMNSFEKVTKTILTDEITNSRQPHIDELQLNLEQTIKELQSVELKIKDQTLFIADNYEIYLGKEFLQVKKLDELIRIVENDLATTINEAIEYYKKTMDV